MCISIIEVANAMLLGAGKLADNGEVAALGVDRRVKESPAAGNEAAIAGVVPIGTRIRVQTALEYFEASGIGFGLDLDDFTAPAHACIGPMLAYRLLRRYWRKIAAGQRRRHGRTATEDQCGECGD